MKFHLYEGSSGITIRFQRPSNLYNSAMRAVQIQDFARAQIGGEFPTRKSGEFFPRKLDWANSQYQSSNDTIQIPFV